MSDQLPFFADLNSLADKLQAQGRAHAFVDAVRRTARTESCLGELREAWRCITLLKSLSSRSMVLDIDQRDVIEAALFSSAVMLYARATHTSANKGERGAVVIMKAFNVGQREDHKAIVDLRNEALAHVRLGQPASGTVWHDAAVCAVSFKDAWKPTSIAKRITITSPMAQLLDRQVPVAIDAMRQALSQRFKNMKDAFWKEFDPSDHDAVLHEHPFDAASFLGSERAVRQAIASIDVGTYSGTTTTVGKKR